MASTLTPEALARKLETEGLEYLTGEDSAYVRAIREAAQVLLSKAPQEWQQPLRDSIYVLGHRGEISWAHVKNEHAKIQNAARALRKFSAEFSRGPRPSGGSPLGVIKRFFSGSGSWKRTVAVGMAGAALGIATEKAEPLKDAKQELFRQGNAIVHETSSQADVAALLANTCRAVDNELVFVHVPGTGIVKSLEITKYRSETHTVQGKQIMSEGVDVIYNPMISLARTYGKVDMYHCHPIRNLEGRGGNLRKTIIRLASAPSPADVQTTLEMTRLVSGDTFRHFIVPYDATMTPGVPLGVFEVGIAPRVQEGIGTLSREEFDTGVKHVVERYEGLLRNYQFSASDFMHRTWNGVDGSSIAHFEQEFMASVRKLGLELSEVRISIPPDVAQQMR